jgi:drug/metabolite transporter (DMT)-like permease
VKPADTAALVTLGALWGSSYLFMRVGAPEFGPVALIVVRVVTAAAMLTPWLLHSGDWRVVWHNRGPVLMIGCFASALPFCLFAYASLTLTAGYTSVINAATPLATAVIAWLWLREGLAGAGILGLAVGLAGVVTLVSGQLAGLDWNAVSAVGAALLAAISYGYSELAAGSQLAATLLLIVPGVYLWPQQPPGPAAWGAGLAMGILGTGIAYVLFFRLVANLGATRAVTVTYLVPMFGMLFGALFLGEVVTPTMLAGCGLILIGTGLATGLVRGWRQPSP